MAYTIGEVAKKFNLTVSTLRYYDKLGLLPLVNRTEGNIRLFDDSDIECLKMIECLKSTGMPLTDIKLFFEWCEEGDSTINKRYELFIKQRQKTLEQIAALKKHLERIEYKCEFYRIAGEKGTTDLPGLKEELAMKFLFNDD